MTKNQDTPTKRFFILFIALLCWGTSHFYLRAIIGPYITQARAIWGHLDIFGSHVFSHSRPVFLVSAILTAVFVQHNYVPKPNFSGNTKNTFKEGVLWGLIACIPVLPLALNMGYHIGFAPDIQKTFGNLISNSYEELIYRVFLLLIITYAFKRISIGVLLSAFFFALVHNQYPLIGQVTVGLAGICFSLAYIRTNNICAALIAHQTSDIVLDTILLS